MSTEARWSRPVEALLAEYPQPLACDVLVIGSGYGGSIAAAELAAPGRSVWVLERGREYALGEFPEDIGQLPGHVRYQSEEARVPTGNADALLDLRLFEQATVLVANGLGGGSLVNAGVALAPPEDRFDAAPWPRALRQRGAQRQAVLDAMAEMRRRLEASPMPDAEALRKVQALGRLGEALGCGGVEPVPLTITHKARTNAAGLRQEACVRCGNCFTGCNTGAKNTLLTNLVPQAARAGARFWTGATALEIEPLADGPSRWRVHVALTARTKSEPGVRHLCVDARTLVLAAGTLGTTELLLRSPRVRCSGRLGQGLSGNGDAIALGWGQRRAVHGVSAPRPDSGAPSTDVGPTIAGTLRTEVPVPGGHRRVLLQDGAVPSALSMAVVALGSTLASLHRYTEEKPPAFHGEQLQADVLATPGAIGEHALLLLAMGEDDGDGQLALGQPLPGSAWQPLKLRWDGLEGRPGRPGRSGGRSPYFQSLHQALVAARAKEGFDGGDYLPSPLWRPVPDNFTGITGGTQPERLVTVHPLGGCGMGDDVASGVVDLYGAVYDGRTPTSVHPGLVVLDGAMLPCAVGVNPFLTISALALVGARRLRAELDAGLPPSAAQAQDLRVPVAQPFAGPREFQPWGPVKLRFEERLQSRGGADAPAWAQALAATGQQRGEPREWIAVVSLEMDVYRWLADPSAPLDAELELRPNPYPESQTVREEALEQPPVLRGRGRVTLLGLDAPSTHAQRRGRAIEAWKTYLARRSTRDFASLGQGGMGPVQAYLLFRRAGRNHAHYRELRYHFELASEQLAWPVQVSGLKRLAYRREERTVWDALTHLDLELRPRPAELPPWRLPLDVDLVDLVKGRRLQVAGAPSTPAAIVAMGSFFALWMRTLLRTHFWSFRGLDYQSLAAVEVPPPPILRPGGLFGRQHHPHREPLVVPRGHSDGGTIQLELTRYEPVKPHPGPCVLLVHGLAHGSGVFTTDTVGRRNMASHFLEAGYTVWLLDHRLSNRLPYAAERHTMDHVAQWDIPPAVQRVHAAHGGREPVHVFAHCVGAGAFAMSVLAGWTPGRLVASATVHAVHPWVVPSLSNRFSGALAALYKDFLPRDQTIDPIPPQGRSGGVFDEVLDRLAASLPWPAGELEDHERHRYDPAGGSAVCNRMTAFYGREWEHGNLEEATHRRLAELVGVAGIEVFRQLYFVILRERLTDRDGANAYMRADHFRRRWTFPTLFAHGGRNQVFDPRGAVRSWNRLQLVFDSGPVRVQRPAVRVLVREGYGHMDFLFGKDAHRDVFPELVRFMEAPDAYQSEVGGRPPGRAQDRGRSVADGEDLTDHEYFAPQAPLCGPLLQVEHGAGGRRLVLWFEQHFDTTSEAAPPRVLLDGQEARVEALALPSQRSEGPKSGNPAVSSGRGVYWTVALDERINPALRTASTIRLEPRYQDVGVERDGRGRGGGVWRPVALDLRREPAAPASDRPTFQSERPAELRLSGLPWWRRWFGGDAARPVSLLATSCRWPGTPFDQRAADALARHMLAHVSDRDRPVDGLVLLGDQIYADATANVAETTEVTERGAERYRAAWQGRYSRQLLRQLPSWLVVDDHEFGDNLDGPGDGEPDKAFVEGFEAAMAYQWRWQRSQQAVPARHPVLPEKGRKARGFWYPFEIGGIPAFAADTRSERDRRTAAKWHQAHLVGDEQLKAIKEWLSLHRTQPKLLFSGSVAGLPELRAQRESAWGLHADDWCGYPATWQELLAHIVQDGIRNLVFVGGDYHLSAVAELEIRGAGGAPPVRALSVVASGWNASLPFANPRRFDFAWGEQRAVPGTCHRVQAWSTPQLLSTAQRQFTKLSIVPEAGRWVLEVASQDEHGDVKKPAGKLFL